MVIVVIVRRRHRNVEMIIGKNASGDRSATALGAVQIQERLEGRQDPRIVSPNVRVDDSRVDGNGQDLTTAVHSIQLASEQEGSQFGQCVSVLSGFCHRRPLPNLTVRQIADSAAKVVHH